VAAWYVGLTLALLCCQLSHGLFILASEGEHGGVGNFVDRTSRA
jgi:hypothetical protein